MKDIFQVIESGSADALRELLAGGADANAVGDEGTTPLCAAAESGSVEMVTALLDSGVSPGYSAGIETPLNCAAASGHDEVLLLLLDRGASVGEMAEEGVTSLLSAAAAGHLSTVEILVAAGADPAFRPDFSDIDDPMTCARSNGHAEVADFLARSARR